MSGDRTARPGDDADDADGDRTDRATDGTGDGRADRTLGVGPAVFVAVHLLALLVLEAPSLPVVVGVEALAVGSLLAGDVAAVGGRDALPATAGALVALAAVGVALGRGAPTWVVAVGLLVAAGALLYAGHRYDRFVAGGEPA